MDNQYQHQRVPPRGATISCGAVYNDLTTLRNRLSKAHEMNRPVGLQVVIDYLLHCYREWAQGSDELEAMREFETRVLNTPFSMYVHPTQWVKGD